MDKKNIIGYYYEIHDKVLSYSDMKPDDFIGSTIKLCFGKIVDEFKKILNIK